MNIIQFFTGRMRRKDYIEAICEQKDRCAQLADDLKHNADMYALDLQKVNAELAKEKCRYAAAERAAQEYLDRAERAEKKYAEMERHMHDMYEQYQSLCGRLERM